MKKKQAENDRAAMSLFEHLEELRQRLIRVIIALLVGVLVGMFVAEPVIAILVAPLTELGIKVQAIKLTESLSVFFRVAVVVGVVLAMPVITYQMFQFAAPGLESRERRYVLIGAPFASLSFAAGVVFAVFVLLPRALPFLMGFMDDIIENRPHIEAYLSTVSNILLWSGLVFETPLVMYFLAKLGVIDAQGFAKVWRVVVIGAAVGAAVITPTVDPVSMLLVMAPFLLLYGLGILLARLA